MIALLKESGKSELPTAPDLAVIPKKVAKELAAKRAREIFAKRKPNPRLDIQVLRRRLMKKGEKAHSGESLYAETSDPHKGAIARYRGLQRKAETEKRPHSAAFHGHMATMLEGGHARVSGQGPSEQIHYRKGSDLEQKHRSLFSKLEEERKARPPQPKAPPKPSAPQPMPPKPGPPKVEVPKVAPQPKVPQPQAPQPKLLPNEQQTKTAAVSSRARLTLALKGLRPEETVKEPLRKLVTKAYPKRSHRGMLSIVEPKKTTKGALSVVTRSKK